MEFYVVVMYWFDFGVGKVVQVLCENGQFNNIFILFFSDNGVCQEDLLGLWIIYFFIGEFGGFFFFLVYELFWVNVSNIFYCLFKFFFYEGGMCMLFIVYWLEQI